MTEVVGHRHGHQPKPTSYTFGPFSRREVQRMKQTPAPVCPCCGVFARAENACYTLSANMEVMTCVEVYG